MNPNGQPTDLCAAAVASGLLPTAGVLTVALSGGADSVALLLTLLTLQKRDANRFGYHLRAVHVHHGLRAAEADRDAAFCKTLCATLGIPLAVRFVDVRNAAAVRHCSLETAARELRYAALAEAAPTGLLATAHHADDQAETMLFRWVRGTGLAGLCGIPARRGRIIRPLLTVTKADILAALAALGQDFVTDSTNLLPDATRNRLRHEMIPLLVRMNPAFVRHCSRMAESLSADEAYLTEQANAAFADASLPSGGWQGLQRLPTPLRRRCLSRCLQTVGIDPSFDRLLRLERLLETGGRVTLSRTVTAWVTRGVLYLTPPRAQTDASVCVPLQLGEQRVQTVLPEKICRAELVEGVTDALSLKIHKLFTKSSLDYDKIKGGPYFRQWTAADTIVLPGRGFASSVKKLIQANVPAPQRRSMVMLCDAEGPIFIEGVGIAARVKPTSDCCRLLRLDCQFITRNKE